MPVVADAPRVSRSKELWVDSGTGTSFAVRLSYGESPVARNYGVSGYLARSDWRAKSMYLKRQQVFDWVARSELYEWKGAQKKNASGFVLIFSTTAKCFKKKKKFVVLLAFGRLYVGLQLDTKRVWWNGCISVHPGHRGSLPLHDHCLESSIYKWSSPRARRGPESESCWY